VTEPLADKWTEKIVALPIAEFVDGDTLRFVRHFDASPARVWETITTRAGWPWVRDMSADLRLGGAFELDFDEDNSMRGRIVTFEPHRLFELEWVEASIDEPGAAPRLHSESVLSFELEPEGEGTKLTLSHRHVTREEAPGFGAGWHAHLGRLQVYLAGDDFELPSMFGALLPKYERLVAEST